MKNVNTIVRLLQQCKIIAIPTESIYGISCIIEPELISKITTIKKRGTDKGFILVSGKINHLLSFVDTKKLTTLQIKKIVTTYGKVRTWVVPARKKVPWLTGNFSNIAIRLSNNPLIKKITAQLDQAIISTSANMTGKAPATTAQEVKHYFKNQLDYIHPSPKKMTFQGKSSQIIDLVSSAVLRA